MNFTLTNEDMANIYGSRWDEEPGPGDFEGDVFWMEWT